MRSALLMLAVTIGPYMWKINAADSSDSTQKKSYQALLERIESEFPVGIERDETGAVVSLILPVRYASDEILRLISQDDRIRFLSFSYNKVLEQPTSGGLMHLKELKSLKSIQLQCADAPAGFLDALTNITHLEKLILVGFSPPQPEAYSSLTNLVGLREFQIIMPKVFGKPEMAALQPLTQLRRVSIESYQIRAEDCGGLLQNTNWTELVVRIGKTKIEMTRKTR